MRYAVSNYVVMGFCHVERKRDIGKVGERRKARERERGREEEREGKGERERDRQRQGERQ